MYYFDPYYSLFFEQLNNDYSEQRSSSSSPFFSLEETFIKGNLIKNQYCPYRNIPQYMPRPKDEKESLLLTLMIYGHNIHDLVLYLDIYKDDPKALNLYKQYKEKYHQLEKEYISKYGPLCPYQETDKKEFMWVKIPSPWLGR